MSNFFVDIDNNGGSLANFIFSGYNPCLIEVSEDFIKCLTNKGTIEFDIARGELSKVDKKFPIADVSMLPELFNYDFKYFTDNLKFDQSMAVYFLEILFEGFLKRGPKGMADALYNYSEGRCDYAKGTQGYYDFWFKNYNDEWQSANFQAMLDLVSERSSKIIPYNFKDNYLWNKNPNHHGVALMRYILANFKKPVGDSQKSVKPVQNFSDTAAEIVRQNKERKKLRDAENEKASAAQKTLEEIKRASKNIFGEDSKKFDSCYAANIFYPIFLDNPDANVDEFAKKICNSIEKSYSKFFWSRDKYHFDGYLKTLNEEIFQKFKIAPRLNSEVALMVVCDEYYKTILFTSKKIIGVNLSEKPRKYSYDEIKNFSFARTEGTLTYDDSIKINGETFARIDFGEKVFKIVKDIFEIFKLKDFYNNKKFAAPAPVEKISAPPAAENFAVKKELLTERELSRQDLINFINRLQKDYNFKSYVYYYNHGGKLDKKVEKKFNAALENYVKLLPNEFPVVLFDSTLFGSATEGFMLTNKGIHIHNSSEDKVFIAYNYNFCALKNDKITVGITELYTGTLSDEKIRPLFNLIQDCRKFFIDVKASPEIDKNKIQNFIQQLQENFYFSSHVYYYNYGGKLDKKIEKKFSAALQSYAKLELNEVPVMLFDSTFFGSATDGFILTNKGIHSNKSKNIFISYENLSSVSIRNDYVTVNSVETDTGFLSDADKKDLVDLIIVCKDFFTGKIQGIKKAPMPYEI